MSDMIDQAVAALNGKLDASGFDGVAKFVIEDEGAIVMDSDGARSGDDDADVVWGRGHNIGLYWLEQKSDGGKRTWQQHTIDTSWSQPHSLVLPEQIQQSLESLTAFPFQCRIGMHDQLCAVPGHFQYFRMEFHLSEVETGRA